MIDPDHMTDFERDLEDLRTFAVFCTLSGNRPSERVAAWVNEVYEGWDWLDDISRPDLEDVLAPIGLQTQFAKALKGLRDANLDLHTCTPGDLCAVPYIGPKKARMFVLHTRREQNYAVLDVRVLKWLRQQGYPKAPKNTPSSEKAYQKWEKIFIEEALKHYSSLAEADIEIWKATT